MSLPSYHFLIHSCYELVAVVVRLKILQYIIKVEWSAHDSQFPIYICRTEFKIMQAHEICRMGRLIINHEIVRTRVRNSCSGHDITP